MPTVFSHIIQKRFSQSYEDVATDALAFILDSNSSARAGMIKLLRGIEANIPDLTFRTQVAEGSTRPDMWGSHESEPRVFIENKFWAGLTDNQPVSYLEQLEKYPAPTILLFVGPEARAHTLWFELMQRLTNADISATDRGASAGVIYSVTLDGDRILALTSWRKLLSALENEVSDDPNDMMDLVQLRALCDAADIDAPFPMSSEELTNQRTPALIKQLGNIIQTAIDAAINEGILEGGGYKSTSTWEGFGRFARFADRHDVGIWLGAYWKLWKEHGLSPLWLIIYHNENGNFSPAHKIRSILEPWAAKEGIFTTWDEHDFSIAMNLATGVELDPVVKGIVDRFRKIAELIRSK